jgi:Holliday junction resolvasome RuvABC ATP-dependent DNA helicase subunit
MLGKTTLAIIYLLMLQVGIKNNLASVMGIATGLLNTRSVMCFWPAKFTGYHPIVEKYLYSAMEDFKIDIMIESNARV